MWTPNQLLHPDVIEALTLSGFSPTQIEFLGWLSYNAAALNNSRNPSKAAHALLSTEKNIKMVDRFLDLKRESLLPKKQADHDEVDRKFAKFDRDVTRVKQMRTMEAAEEAANGK
jgi:hypothetical protein